MYQRWYIRFSSQIAVTSKRKYIVNFAFQFRVGNKKKALKIRTKIKKDKLECDRYRSKSCKKEELRRIYEDIMTFENKAEASELKQI